MTKPKRNRGAMPVSGRLRKKLEPRPCPKVLWHIIHRCGRWDPTGFGAKWATDALMPCGENCTVEAYVPRGAR